MAAKGIASVGECMIELSGADAGLWRMGFAGDSFNTLWALRALTGEAAPADYVSAFGDDPFSRDQIAFFAAHGIGTASSPVIAGCPARPLRDHADRRRAVLHLLARRCGRAAAGRRSGRTWRKALKTGRLSIFPESLWQFSSRPRGSACLPPSAQRAAQAIADRLRPELPAAAVAGCRGGARSDRRGAEHRRHRAADLSRRAGAVRRRRS